MYQSAQNDTFRTKCIKVHDLHDMHDLHDLAVAKTTDGVPTAAANAGSVRIGSSSDRVLGRGTEI